MKLFSSTQISWNEPLFFVVRLRERSGWIRRALLALGIVAVMFLAIHFTRKPQIGIGKAIGISLVAGVFLVALLDVANIQREVTIKEDGISYQSATGAIWRWMGSFALKDILNVRLMRPEDWNRACGAMLVQTNDDAFLLGVPNKVQLATIANILHRLEVRVELEGWEPSESDTRVQVLEEAVIADGASEPAGTGRIWPVEDQEGRLDPPPATAIGLAIALGPALLSLVGLIAAVIWLILKWGSLAALDKWIIGGGALAALVLSVVYMVLVGQFLSARYLIGVARGALRSRPNALFTGTEEDLIPVEIFDRAAWTSVMARAVDFGFLQVDERLRFLRFEGNKNRWDIPRGALTACRIEEAHVGSEGNQNAEKRYYVVIALNRDGEPWEAGMIHTRTQFGSDGKDQRYARAQALFRRISPSG